MKHSISSRIALAALFASFAHAASAKTVHHAAPPQPVESGPTNAELQQEIEQLQDELQQAQTAAAQANNRVDNINTKPPSGWWDNTTVSGRMYYDFTDIDHKINGSKTGLKDNGAAFDIKRFYLGVDHKFNDVFSANLTTDFQWNSGLGATELYIKKAYLQAKLSDAVVLKFGSTDLPWIPFAEDLYGYRYLENTLIDRTKYGTSADWGIHASGKLQNGLFNYAISVVNGAGYKNPPGTGNAPRFKSIDVEGRANVNLGDFVIGVGGYSGKLGKDQQGVATHHTATRLDAIAAYTTKQARLGVEYFHANDFMSVTSTTGEKADGVSGFGSYYFTPQWGVFGRYDYVRTNKDNPTPEAKDNYYTFGVSYSPAKIVDFSLAYKHERATGNSLGTSNGTMGALGGNGTYSEVGVWSQFRW